MKEKNMLLIFLLIFIVLTAGGCAEEPQMPMRIGTNVWPGYEPLYLAREMGFFGNTSVKLVEYPSSSETIRAFRNGAIDAAGLTLDEAFRMAATGPDLKVVLVMDISDGGDVLLARPRIRSIKDLRGKSIGVETAALGSYMLTRALQTASMQPSDVKTVPLEGFELVRAFQEGRIDAAVTFEPVRTRLLKADARILFDSSRIPGEIVDVLVVRSDYIRGHEGRIASVLRGWFRALDYLRIEKVRAVRIMAQREHVTPENFLQSLHGLRIPDLDENLVLLNRTLFRPARRVKKVMLENGLINRNVDVRQLLDASHLKGVKP